MAAATLISVEEYLATSYRPDRELIDGQVVERNLGEYDHGNLQGALILLLRSRQLESNIRVAPEQRVRIKPDRFRIPDVSVVSRHQPVEQIFTHPPLVCIEVLSPEDTLRSIEDRVDDYLNFGVRNIWVLDPRKRRAHVCTSRGFVEPEDRVLAVAGTPIRLPLDELFAELD